MSPFTPLDLRGELEIRKLIDVLFLRHVDLRGNLLKAMMVINWLNMLDVEKH